MSLYSAQRLHLLRMIVTGGHTYPALTTIDTLKARLAETGTAPELLWVGVADGLEATIAARNGIPFRAITTGKLRRSPGPTGGGSQENESCSHKLTSQTTVLRQSRPTDTPAARGGASSDREPGIRAQARIQESPNIYQAPTGQTLPRKAVGPHRQPRALRDSAGLRRQNGRS